jgi:hypothetical protein
MVKSFADPSAHVGSEIFCMVPTVSSSLEEPIGIGESKETGEDWLFHAAKCIALKSPSRFLRQVNCNGRSREKLV